MAISGIKMPNLGNIGMTDMTGAMGMVDFSALTGASSLSASDTATLSNVLGDDYTNYQNMLSGINTSLTSGNSQIDTGVKAATDGMFDFTHYFNTYFPNLSAEEVSSLTSYYTEQFNTMYKQIGNAMDMSGLASMVTGMSGMTGLTNGLTADSIAASAATASGGSLSFDINSYLDTYFPALTKTDAAAVTARYEEQYKGMNK